MPSDIKYVRGDLFDTLKQWDASYIGYQTVLLPHVVNNIGAWGAGFTRALDKHLPEVGVEFRRQYAVCGIDAEKLLGRVGETHCFLGVSLIVLDMYAQDGIGTDRRRLNYIALAKCMEYITNTYPSRKIFAPQFGSGLAGGDWDFIEQLIHDAWVSHGFDVTISIL